MTSRPTDIFKCASCHTLLHTHTHKRTHTHTHTPDFGIFHICSWSVPAYKSLKYSHLFSFSTRFPICFVRKADGIGMGMGMGLRDGRKWKGQREEKEEDSAWFTYSLCSTFWHLKSHYKVQKFCVRRRTDNRNKVAQAATWQRVKALPNGIAK